MGKVHRAGVRPGPAGLVLYSNRMVIKSAKASILFTFLGPLAGLFSMLGDTRNYHCAFIELRSDNCPIKLVS